MNPLEHYLEEERKEIHTIEENIERINESLLEKVPSKFALIDIINAVFGSLILGLTFVLKGGVIEVALNLETVHIILIIITTLAILMIEIYFIAYARVKNRNDRKLGQFIIKRLFSLYLVTILVTMGLVYILNLNNHPLVQNQLGNIFKVVIVNSFPCAIGAAIPSLLKKY